MKFALSLFELRRQNGCRLPLRVLSMRRFLPAALFLASCADAPVQPPLPPLERFASAQRSFTDLTWARSTTGIEVIPIGQFDGAYTVLVDINASGLATGWRNVPGVGEQAISWQNGEFRLLPGLGGGFSRAYQVNSAGVIVGEASNEFGFIRPVVWENGAIRALPPLDQMNAGFGVARAINERGDVVGSDSRSFVTYAVLWPADGGVVEIGLLPGANIGWATGINNDGHVFGQSIYFADFSQRAMRWINGSLTEVQMPPGAVPAGADIATGRMFNDAGEFLGEIRNSTPFTQLSLVFRAGAFQTLPFLDASRQVSWAYGLNNLGDVAGASQGQSDTRAVVWRSDGTLTDLGFPPGWTTGAAFAHGINDDGYVIGEADGEWTPGRVGTGAVMWRLVSDDTPPTITYSSHPGVFLVDERIVITCTAADEGSGVASHTCVDLVGDAYAFGPGEHVFSATATDNAGNSGSGSTSFTVRVTAGSLANLTRRFFPDGGLANSLTNLLDASERSGSKNQLDGFRSVVGAQVGKKISAENAAILIELSRQL